MSAMQEMKAIVRTDCVARLVHALRDAGISRFWISHVHSLGGGVDPEHLRPSLAEGESYTEKAKVEFLCPSEKMEDLVTVVRDHASTGHKGDGVVIVSDVAEVVAIRTGDRDHLAIL